MNFSRLQKVYAKFGGKAIDVKPGQLLEIHEEVGTEDNKRNWKFKGLVIKVWKAGHPDGTFTVRGISSGVVVEKIYPFSFPRFKQVLLMDEYKVRRAKLYYIRDKVGKGARMKSLITPERRGLDLIAEAKELAAKEAEKNVVEAPKAAEVEEKIEVTNEEVVAAVEAPVVETKTEETTEDKKE